MQIMKYGVIVSGVPASGKTTIARELAENLCFEFLDKDDFLEDLYEKHGVQSWEDRTRLSRQSDQLFQAAAQRAASAVLVSHWRSLGSTHESGTSSDWLANDYDRLVEVYCTCAPNVALKRFQARKRHPGHLDDQSDASELKNRMTSWASRFPLGIGPLFQVNTEFGVDTVALSSTIQSFLARN